MFFYETYTEPSANPSNTYNYYWNSLDHRIISDKMSRAILLISFLGFSSVRECAAVSIVETKRNISKRRFDAVASQ